MRSVVFVAGVAVVVGAMLGAAGYRRAPSPAPLAHETAGAAPSVAELNRPPVDPNLLLDQALVKGRWTRTDARALHGVILRAPPEERAAVLSRLTTAINDGKLRVDGPRLF